MSIRLVLVTALALVACSSAKADDPFTADMKTICNAGRDADPGLPPELAKMQAFRGLAAKIKTPEAARLVAAVVQAAPDQKAALLAEPLKRAGLSRCPLLSE